MLALAALPEMEPMATEYPPAQELHDDADTYLRYVGVHLRTERKRLGLTQGDVAERAGRTKGWVSQVENGLNDSHKAAKTYAMTLGIDFAYIVSMAETSKLLRSPTRNRHGGEAMLTPSFQVVAVADQHKELTEEEIAERVERLYGAICEQLRREREAMHLDDGGRMTQSEAARRAHLNSRTPSTIERKDNTNIKTIIQYALGLGLKWEEVVLKAALTAEAQNVDLTSIINRNS